MAKTTTTEWAIGPWSRRGSLNYVPIDQPFNGAYFTERPGSRNAPRRWRNGSPIKWRIPVPELRTSHTHLRTMRKSCATRRNNL